MRSIFSLALVVALSVGAWARPVGLWLVGHGDGQPLSIRIYSNGTARSDYESNGLGRWSWRDSVLTVDWQDGWRDVIALDSKRAWAPGADFQGEPSNTSSAVFVTPAPDGWFGGDD